MFPLKCPQNNNAVVSVYQFLFCMCESVWDLMQVHLSAVSDTQSCC